MSWVAASGRDTYETCEADTCTIVAVRALGHEPLERWWDRLVLRAEQVPARQRLPRRRARRRAGERGGRVRPLRSGHDVRRGLVNVGRERLTERLGIEEEVHALAPIRAGERHGPDRGTHEAALEPLKELLLALALVAHPPVEIDQCLDLVVADRGRRDDVPTVGVTDKHDRAGKRPQE